MIMIINHLAPWKCPPRQLRLGSGEIHLWRFALSGDALTPESEVLSSDEQCRFARLRDPDRRDRRARARACLRNILAGYLALLPEDLPLTEDPSGKPQLATPGWHFNLSHSAAWGCLAINRDGPIGVDIERIDPHLDQQQIITRLFPDWQTLETSVPRSRRGFYRRWTGYEALSKRDGSGLGTPHSVPFATETKIRHFYLAPGYVACLAVSKPAERLYRYDGPLRESQIRLSND